MNQLDIAIVTPGQFAAAADGSSSVERVSVETGVRLPPPIQATIYSRRTAGMSARQQVGPVLHRRIRAASRSSYIRQVRYHLRSYSPDIIQLENRPFLVPLFRRRFPSKPIILSLHSTTFINPRVYGRRAIRNCLAQADYIAVNSEFLAGWIRDRLGVPAAKLWVCHPGVDVHRFASKHSPQGRAQAARLRAEYALEGKKIILFMGRLVPIKGVHHLLTAMPQVLAQHEDAVLVICGSAKYGSNRMTPYVKKLHQLGSTMPQHVRFFPYVPHSMVSAWYQAADVFVAPSASREAFGLVNAEASACGVPIVATRAGGIGEIVKQGVNGLLVDPAHIRYQLPMVLNNLLDDPVLREHLGRGGIQRVHEGFTWERTAENYARLYQSCLDIVRKQRRRRRSRS